MTKLLFLDCDGVLNTRPGSLDADKLDLVARIVRETGCKVIVSSTWRKTEHQMARLRASLHDRGVEIAGATPVMDKKVGWLWTAPSRGDEIMEWLVDSPFFDDADFSRVIVLDDEDAGYHLPQIRTDPSIGLTPQQAEETIARLNS